MIMLIMYTALFGIFLLADTLSLYQEKKSFWTNLTLLSLAYLLSVLIALQIQVPSPAKPLENLIKAVGGGQ